MGTVCSKSVEAIEPEGNVEKQPNEAKSEVVQDAIAVDDETDEFDNDFEGMSEDVEENEDDLLVEDELDVEVWAIKPWLGSIFEPDEHPDFDPSPPEENLVIEWVYGYRCHDSRNNIAILKSGEIVYPAAAIVVKLDSRNRTQEYMRLHNDDVMCLAQSPADPSVIVTGQMATLVEGKRKRRSGAPYVCVWNTETGEETKIASAAKRCVRSVGVNLSGEKICVVGNDNNFTVNVFTLDGVRVGSATTGNNKIYQALWSNTDENTFYVCGSKTVQRCTANGGVQAKRMLFGKFSSVSRHHHLCMCMTGKGKLLTGTSKGYICVFKDGKCVKVERISKRPIYSITRIDKENDEFLIGGADEIIYHYNKSLDLIQTQNIGEKIRALVVRGNTVVVGTLDGNIYETDLSNIGGDLGAPVMRSHSDGELWAVCDHPQETDQFLTAGEDNKIMAWSKSQHECIAQTIIDPEKGKKKKRRRVGTTSTEPPNRCARSISANPNGDISVGVNTGVVHIFSRDLQKQTTIDLNRKGKRKVKNQSDNWIECMAYSPDGSILAVGTHGMVICLLDVENGYKCSGVLKAHNAPITNLDWSECGNYLQSVCIAYELLFHSIDRDDLQASSQHTAPSELTHIKWATQTCKFGWPVQGVFGFTVNGTDVNRCAKDPESRFIFSATDWGRIDMFRYPALEDAEPRKCSGHSSHVTNVIATESHIFSTGGNDKTIIQWRLESML